MQPTLKLLLVLLLGGWLGASLFFTFVAAPSLFQLAGAEVITREQAGNVAGALLKRYFVCALIVFVLALALSGYLAFAVATPSPRFSKCAIITLAAVLLTSFTTFVWTPKVHQAREQRRVSPGPETERQFRMAHHVSFAINLVVIAGNAVAFVVVARPE